MVHNKGRKPPKKLNQRSVKKGREKQKSDGPRKRQVEKNNKIK